MVAKTKMKLKNLYDTLYRKKKYLHLRNWGKTQVLKLCNWIFTFLCLFAPILIFYVTESIVHDIPKYMNSNAQMLNILLLEILLFCLFGLTGSLRASLIIESVFFTVFALVNYFVISFRSTPVQPWDLYSIGTAGSVASEYKYELSGDVILRLLIMAVLIAIFCFVKCKLPLARFWGMRLVILGVSIGCLANFTTKLHTDSFVASMKLYDKLFTPTTIYYKDGGPLAFLMETKYLSVDVPEGYSAKQAKELLDSYGNEDTTAFTADTADQPNIIVIMDEAFSDPSILGDFTTNEDYMPFIRSLQTSNQATTGYLNVSVVGGNTANSEFEFLTGNTMAFLPTGSVAYQQYIHNNIDCLPSYLKDLGYHTYASHPYNASGWSRDKVYPMMGFDEMTFIDDYKDAEYVRNYVSDQSCVDYIISTYEKNEATDAPFFMFLVTMQNHSSYTKEYENFTPDITVDGSDSFALSSYLSLMKKTDSAMANLIDYFQQQEEDTVIVFFGDHQPANSVVSDIYKLNGSSVSKVTGEEQNLRYKVPFFIWSNFEQEHSSELHGIETSANYLALEMMKIAGLPLSNYQNFLLTVQEEIPIISAQTIQDSTGTTFSLDQLPSSLDDYKSLAYYQLFDAQNE